VTTPFATTEPQASGWIPSVSPLPFLGLAALGIALLLRR